MSPDLDNFKGEFDPAAGDHEVNSYDQEGLDYPVHTELLEKPVDEQVQLVGEKDVNPQAEHFRAFRDEVERMKAEREAEKREFQLQMEMYKANMAQVQSPHPAQKDRKFLDGMDDNDIPNVAEIRREWEAREYAYRSQLEELQVMQSNPDYAEVLEKYTTSLLKNDPTFRGQLERADNKAMYAYQQGKKEQRLQELENTLKEYQQPQVNRNAERIVENARKPGTLSQAGGQNSLSKADYFATMSDAEFMKYASRNLEGI